MMQIIRYIVVSIIVCGITGFAWYKYFYVKEKKLLNRLEKMIEDTKNGELIRSEISEEKLSAVENSLKRYLDDNLLENKNQKRQKELIQKLISDIAHQTLTPVSNLKIYTELLWESQKENEIINTIMEQTDKLEFLIESLIKLSRLESGIIEALYKF